MAWPLLGRVFILGEFVRALILASAGGVEGVPTLAKVAKGVVIMISVFAAFILRAAIIPFAVVKEQAKFIAHTNSHKFMLNEDVWKAERVEDVTDRLRAILL